MKPMTQFQEALLTATEAQFADVPEEEQTNIQPTSDFYDHVPGKKKPLKPLRRAILIAAALALFVSAAFASHFFTLGGAEVREFPFSLEEIPNSCYSLEVKFYDDFANENAPDTIETYYLPTKDLSIESAEQIEVGNESVRFHPLLDEETKEFFSDYDWYTDRLPENPTSFSVGWSRYIDQMNGIGQQILFSQMLAKRAPGAVQTIAYLRDSNPEAQSEVLQIENHEVLSIRMDYDLPFGRGRRTTYYWYWTDGDYLFRLMADDVDQDYMQQLMESVQPMEDMTAYLDQG